MQRQPRFAAKLAPERLWSLSLLETGVSVVILATALRLAVPGRVLCGSKVLAVAILACLTCALANSTIQSPGTVDTHTQMRWLVGCIHMAIVLSIPALLLPIWLVARALPHRPALTSALCGVSVGLMADAGVRLLCWDGGVAHLILSHGSAILLLVGLEAGLTHFVERIKSAALHRP